MTSCGQSEVITMAADDALMQAMRDSCGRLGLCSISSNDGISYNRGWNFSHVL